ncbi:RNA polymerase sigma factor (sigma-70 family) [Arcicella aurantiaca]|jgi:RNA polymerase sigma factor (sigma-70 family)|uniref:RNA polymerase sigma factor (Sigma-70 family) n=1 Tax=Arcicella aurantiaca TaxID=591202 RepID=A0A316E074_9BACT|nr:sigma-70 family RNA polymerase sigma factor [Arcicella aurantiaca]PWK23834.1 RNA polymerase sigma factor (sigma-70 family) [Arcicella aurantiaca]
MFEVIKDIEIWESFRNGDEDAYSILYREHVGAMYRYGMSLSSLSEYFVFDCIHDVFTEIWAKRATITTPTNIRSYLLKALKNRMQNQILRRESKFLPIKDGEFDELWEDSVSDEMAFFNNYGFSKEELVNKLIAQLPPRQQEALRLRFVEELEYSEVANVMSINRQSAQNLVVRAVEKLRKTFPSLNL